MTPGSNIKRTPPAVVVTTTKKRVNASAAPSGGGLQARLARNRATASVPNKKRKVASQPAKEELSSRAQRILNDSELEDAIKSSYGPQPREKFISTRTLPFHLDVDQPNHRNEHASPPHPVPWSLAEFCIRIAARNFDSHILPLGLEKPIEGEEDAKEMHKAGPNGAGNILEKARNPVVKRAATEVRQVGRSKRKPQAGLFNYDESLDGDYSDSEPAGNAKGSARERRSRAVKVSDGLHLTAHDRMQRAWPSHEAKHHWHLANSAFLRSWLPPKSYAQLQAALLRYSPQCLTKHVLATYFVLGRESIQLSSSIDAVSNHSLWPATLLSLVLAPGSATINGVGPIVSLEDEDEDDQPLAKSKRRVAQQSIQSLRLEGLTRLSSRTVHGFFDRYIATQHLTTVSLAGCIGVGPPAITRLVERCAGTLTSLNLSNTDIGIMGFGAVLRHCGARLEVLKCASVEGLTDEAVPPILTRIIQDGAIANPPYIPLARLRTLKLRDTDVGDVAASSLLKLCAGSLENLDLSRTQVADRGSFSLLGMTLGLTGFGNDAPANKPGRLRKLNLSGLLCWEPSFSQFIAAICADRAATLQTLVLAGMRMSSSNPETLRRPIIEPGLAGEALEAVRSSLTPLLEARRAQRYNAARPLFERISLKNNARLGSRSGATARGNAFEEEVMMRFVRDVGRHCRRLDLSGISVGPEDVPFDHGGQPCALQELFLNNSDLPDGVLANIGAGCRSLQRLEIAGAHADTERIDRIVDANRFLRELDLTLCRGIARGERRDFFRACEERTSDAAEEP